MTACCTCGAEPAYMPAYSALAYCRAHFQSLIERRVRKDIRINQRINLRESYHLVDDGSAKAGFMRELLERIFQGRLQIDAQASRTIEPACLEEDVSERFANFLAKRPLIVGGIRPLRTLTAADIVFLTSEEIPMNAHELLLAIESDQPGSLFAMGKLLRK